MKKKDFVTFYLHFFLTYFRLKMCIQCTLKQRIDECSNSVEREAIETLLSIGNVLNSKDYCEVYKSRQTGSTKTCIQPTPSPKKESKLAMVSSYITFIQKKALNFLMKNKICCLTIWAK